MIILPELNNISVSLDTVCNVIVKLQKTKTTLQVDLKLLAQ
jgi:hypothetical protein